MHKLSRSDRGKEVLDVQTRLRATGFSTLALQRRRVARGVRIGRLLLPTQPLLLRTRQAADRCVGARLARTGAPCSGEVGRNYGVLRETRDIALVVEPLFLTNPVEERLSRRHDHAEALAQAICHGFADYLARTRLSEDS